MTLYKTSQVHQNGWHQFASPIPPLTPLNHNCREKNTQEMRTTHMLISLSCEWNRLVLLPAPANLAAGPPSYSKHWAVSRGLWKERQRGKGKAERKGRGCRPTFHSAGQCIQGDSCHSSADHQNPENRSGRICDNGGSCTSLLILFWQ